MSQALYRKYRSLTLDDVLGQEHIVSILRRALEKGRVAHAYLLSGPRGTGKTSVARILAHHINQLPYDKESSHIDIIEIDAASNNGVDDIRNLREKSRIAPVTAQYKSPAAWLISSIMSVSVSVLRISQRRAIWLKAPRNMFRNTRGFTSGLKAPVSMPSLTTSSMIP